MYHEKESEKYKEEEEKKKKRRMVKMNARNGKRKRERGEER